MDALRQQIEAQHAEIEDFVDRLHRREADAIVEYCAMVLENSEYPDVFPQHARLAYVPESAQLVIEYDLPTFEAIPTVESYRYVKSKDDITSKAWPETKRRALYTEVLSQVTLRTIHEVFEADRDETIETVVFNGHVDTIDRGTGRSIRPCVVTLRCTRETFLALDLRHVEPQVCLKTLNAGVSKKPTELKTLNAGVSKKPTELAPVRPVLEFDMVDRRFVDEIDVLSDLDQRPNLMDLSPFEFENVVTNLFTHMGLETRQTMSSRDGGVDCVAFDPRAVVGGKVVIQAKRYKNTVGVSAVRDLFGTVQNEGASKGILVTTSGYGPASYEFANGKPLELLDGSNLLHLLAEHADIEAKIEVPEDWVDPGRE